MTREEQIEQAAEDFAGINYDVETESDSFYHHVQKESFMTGAEWADKTIVDNICEWLNNNLTEENYLEFDEDGFLSINKENIINDIRKIKEE